MSTAAFYILNHNFNLNIVTHLNSDGGPTFVPTKTFGMYTVFFFFGKFTLVFSSQTYSSNLGAHPDVGERG